MLEQILIAKVFNFGGICSTSMVGNRAETLFLAGRTGLL